jgi:hypothetical protein
VLRDKKVVGVFCAFFRAPLHRKDARFLWVEFVIDESQENTLNMWIVADNLQKGCYYRSNCKYLIANKLGVNQFVF